MRPSPVNSFTRNVIGFGVFIAVSFGVTIAANMLSTEQTREEQVAAAAARMLETIR